MNIEIRKFWCILFLAIASVAATSFLWERIFYLTLVLAFIGLLMLLVERQKNSVILFVIIFFLGPLFEAFMIYKGAWHYTNPYFIGIPIWLPFLWGNAALFIKRITCLVKQKSPGC